MIPDFCLKFLFGAGRTRDTLDTPHLADSRYFECYRLTEAKAHPVVSILKSLIPEGKR